MKAWKVTDLCEEYSTIVFAESRNKARLEAMCTDVCYGMEYIEINPIRVPWADEMYHGSREMDWYDADDRIALVKHGWSCLEPEYSDCKSCPAKKWCEYGEQENPYESEGER